MYVKKQEELNEGKFADKDIGKIIFGPDIKYIPENCFNGCKNLKEIVFEGSINSVEAAAFMNCENLQVINANTINIIKDFAFHGCNNIFNFNIKEDIAVNIKYGINNDVLSTYFILPEIGTPLNDISWYKINMISKKGKTKDYFKIGNEKEININSRTYHIQIFDFNHDILNDNPNEKANITFGLKENIITKHVMNSICTNIGSWKNSEIRKYINKDIYNSLPQEIKTIIKPVNKLTSKGNKSTKIETTSDKLFLLSEIEILGLTRWSANGEGEQYKYFINNPKLNYSTSWWLRSPVVSHPYYFCCIDNNGNTNMINAYCTHGIIFGFCI